MKPELENKLCREFPHLFGDRNAPLTQSLLGFGLECGDGWYDLLYKAASKLEPLIVKWIDEKIKSGKTDELDWMPRAVQVKEKYGQLRIYLTSETEEMSKVIRRAEKESETTCEECGEKGKLRGEGWYYTRCDACWKKLHMERYGTLPPPEDHSKDKKWCEACEHSHKSRYNCGRKDCGCKEQD